MFPAPYLPAFIRKVLDPHGGENLENTVQSLAQVDPVGQVTRGLAMIVKGEIQLRMLRCISQRKSNLRVDSGVVL